VLEKIPPIAIPHITSPGESKAPPYVHVAGSGTAAATRS
jgi:hypothetical protein